MTNRLTQCYSPLTRPVVITHRLVAITRIVVIIHRFAVTTVITGAPRAVSRVPSPWSVREVSRLLSWSGPVSRPAALGSIWCIYTASSRKLPGLDSLSNPSEETSFNRICHLAVIILSTKRIWTTPSVKLSGDRTPVKD